MKKAWKVFLLSLCLLTALSCAADAANEDFAIENGILTEYHGAGGAVVIPDGVQVIESAFMDDPAITSVTIPGSVLKIGASAFARCENLSELTLAEGLLTIEDHAFEKCPIARLYIPDSVAFIGSLAFSSPQLTEVRLPSATQVWDDAFWTSPWGKANEQVIIERWPTVGNEAWSEFTSTAPTTPTVQIGDFTMRGNVVVGYQGAGGVVTIPDRASAIGARAFYQNKSITAVVMGSHVKLIGTSAFEGCTALRQVSPLADDFYRICRNAFFDCENLTAFDRPVQTPVSENSFENTPYQSTKGNMRLSEQAFVRNRTYNGEFMDMDPKTWCYSYVMRGYETGVFDCPADRKLRANDTLTSGEAVKIAALIHASATGNLSRLGSPAEGFQTYYEYVRRYFRFNMSQLEDPNRPVARNVFAGLLYDALPGTAWPSVSNSKQFPDLEQYSGNENTYFSVACRSEIDYLYNLGVCVAYSDGKFHPERNITRGEAFVMAARAIDPTLRAA